MPNTVSPVWTPDGKRVLFAADTAGHLDLYAKASDGTGKEELLLSGDSDKFADDVSPDGRYLLYEQYSENLGWSELWMLSLTGEGKPRPYLQGKHT
jgi:Tol biopolymer transport system component